jgi:hypothetical protein
VSKFARLSRRPYAGGQTAAKKVLDAPSFGFVIPVEFSPFDCNGGSESPLPGRSQPTFALVKDRAATRNNLVGAMGCAADGASSSGNCEIRKIDTSNL